MDAAFINKLMSLKDEDYNYDIHNVLSRLIKKYPYFSLPYYYNAKCAKKLNNSVKEALSLASAYSCDRVKLKEFMETKMAFQYNENSYEPTAMDKINAKIEELSKLYNISKKETIEKDKKVDIIEEIDSFCEPDIPLTPTKSELIERFLNIENPKVKITKETFETENVGEIFKKSASDDFEIVTQTMAEMYAKQGNKDKAIKIYTKLILVNPEKSIYFASQIEKLKN
ncbi:MAG: hypothetical protein LBM25_03145 [Bacteroidales bacterium]|jgi:tetratricopeptide (TPR) repeat protein|nr:hypothetical protein [Bacteroidales bacterium]